MEALTDRFDTPHSIWFYGGEIDVEQSARHHRQVQQRAQNFLPPSLCAGEGHGVSHAFPRVCLTSAIERNPANVPSIAAETVPDYVTSSAMFAPRFTLDRIRSGGEIGRAPCRERVCQYV